MMTVAQGAARRQALNALGVLLSQQQDNCATDLSRFHNHFNPHAS
jgi:hypothetical protein